ncbi:hypothetical protein B0T22DRAFT_370084 [Podospora appendiculata]|uniref:polynucleotide adenylyltransferase n=1 Tax=Podospora appendiculata TaxID=314037 RepID=A0AAE0XJT7_9PEZI|nr:hypothetical protein B0T22DRAFT_370084 [Podospora appendiculata]
MDGQPTAAESKHHYQPNPWPRAPSTSSAPRANPTSIPEASPGFFPTHLDFVPILYPHQSSVFHEQLLHYNKLLSAGRGGGGGIQTPALPPAASSGTPHAQSTTRSRSSSKVSNKENLHAKPTAQSCHGSRAVKITDIAERALMKPGKEPPSKMSGKKHSEPSTSHGLPARPLPHSGQAAPPLHAAQSSSVPSTPHQHARKFSFESREQSPGATQNHSPRSAYSETNGNVPSLRPLPPRLGGCRFETAVPHSRRRMPYSLGTDPLEAVDPNKIKSKLSEDDERQLTTDMRELYDRLLPTKEVEINRRKLVNKLERLLNEEWPGHNIQVHLFGSSGNLLCSDDSDVDICVTTEWKELENVCLIADLLDRHGMEKVVCVSSAKVPIVKIWDPELNLACDMNVNNTLALENTRMVRTYVEVDDRVRPLAMIIKYWTRRRIVNDAAFGGTLSSYTWICLIIAFLQLRDPPVLPALHQRHSQKLLKEDGTKSEFADDLDKLRGFGARNKESLAALLFHFFRFYAHEFNYDKYALSIRLGKMLTKVEKKWQFGTNNLLCIEEPFNIIRNLGNTADDTSFRGLHLELRRAFDLIAQGKFEEACEEYVYPKEEERIWQKPAAASRPILVRSSSQQTGRGGGRGGFRAARQFHRNGNSSRRASSSVTHDTNSAFAQAMPLAMNPADMMWYQSQGGQLTVPQEQLIASLQAQENTLRFQLYTQAQQINQQQALAHAQRMQGGSTQATDRSRTNSFDNAPLTAPLRPEMIYYGFPMQHTPWFHPGFTTYPTSPVATSATANGTPEFRRSLHRSTVTTDSGASTGSGALRSQSQPASRTPMASQTGPGYAGSSQPRSGISVFQSRQGNGVPIPSFMPDETAEAEYDDAPTKAFSESPPEYIAYCTNETSSPARTANGLPSAVPAFGDLGQNAQGRRRLSTDQLPQSILDRRMKRTSRSPSPLGHARAFSVGTNSAPLVSAPFQQSNGKLTANRGPPVVNGTVMKSGPSMAAGRQQPSPEHSASDESNYDNPLYISHGPEINRLPPDQPLLPPPNTMASPPLHPDRPVIVNGTSISRSPVVAQGTADASFQQRVAMGANLHNGISYTNGNSEVNGMAGFSPPAGGRSRVISRQQQSGIAPLDLATSDLTVTQDQHLSPVYENRTPSPTILRRFDIPTIAPYPKGAFGNETRTESPKGAQKSTPTKTPPTGPKLESSNRSPILDSRIGGTTRESGHARSAKSQSDSSGGWQKPKPRKKGVPDLKQTANGFAQGEQLPRNDADRKGG